MCQSACVAVTHLPEPSLKRLHIKASDYAGQSRNAASLQRRLQLTLITTAATANLNSQQTSSFSLDTDLLETKTKARVGDLDKMCNVASLMYTCGRLQRP